MKTFLMWTSLSIFANTDSALEAIAGIRLTADNYTVAIDTLTERYGNPETATFAHIEQLLAVPSAEKDGSKLQSVYDECERHIKSLVALGLNEQTFGKVFIPIIFHKLPKATRVQLHRANGSKPWELATLRTLMKQELQARLMSERFSGNLGPSQGAPRDSTNNQVYHGPRQSGNGHNGHGKQANGRPKPKVQQWSTQGALFSNASSTTRCAFCSGAHFSDNCTRFRSAEERKRIAQEKRLCFKCLADTHLVLECKRSKACYHCQRSGHHSSLCLNNGSRATGQGAKGSTVSTTKTAMLATKETSDSPDLDDQDEAAILMMATVAYPEHDVRARICLDGASTTSFVTSKLAKRLQLHVRTDSYLSIRGVGSRKGRTKPRKVASVPLPLRDGTVFPIKAHVIDVVTGPVPKLSLDAEKHPILSTVPLADTVGQGSEMVELDMLIGGNYMHRLLTGERIQLSDDLFLYGSRLGYIPAGTVGTEATHTDVVSMFVHAHSVQQEEQMARFWELEDIGVRDDPYLSDDQKAQNMFDQGVQQVNGRYQVSLPWKDEEPTLPTNYGLAVTRLKSQLARLKGQPELAEEYSRAIEEQVDAGVVETVEPRSDATRVHYLPHHCVVKPDSATTKVRVVYDASAKSRRDGHSLNECLLRGPINLQDLCGMLLRFRLHSVAWVCDIEKAFHQVGIAPADRDVLRFLWVKDNKRPPVPGNLVTYRFTRVVFGVICSPFLLDATIKHHLQHQSTAVSKQIMANIYVDNVLGGQSTASRALIDYKEAKGLFSQIRMNLREWYSNSPAFQRGIDGSDRGQRDQPKVLGLKWDTTNDTLACGVPPVGSSQPTKRSMLSEVAAIYDPCGWLSPVTIRAKMLVQDLWRDKVDWDARLPSNVQRQFQDLRLDLSEAANWSIGRLTNKLVAHSGVDNQLHVFCDASAKAYGAVAYLRSQSGPTVATGIVMAKARLAPIKPVSIPRLELMASVVAVRMVKFLRRELELPISKTTIWSDSKCVLHWLTSTKPLRVFVRNRIAELRTLAKDNAVFRYVPTACNPADIPTKGCSYVDLVSERLWWAGPSFLSLPDDKWPENEFEGMEHNREVTDEFAMGPKGSPHCLITISEPPLMDTGRYSSWTKAVRVVARVLDAIRRFKGETVGDDLFSGANVARARSVLIKQAQSAVRADSLELRHNWARQLGLYVDDVGIVRCKGRLENARLSSEEQRPMFLPKDHPTTRLIINHCHQLVGHAGVRHTLAELRHDYWIVQGRAQVQRVLHRCQLCRKSAGGPFQLPDAPPLPTCRVTEATPFDRVGLDYFGPLFVKGHDQSDPTPHKVWVCLFTCCVTRAIHLEVVSELSTEQFMLGFRRFAATYGKPSLVISDNAKQFRAASNVLKAAFRQAQGGWASGIEWKFITELAPWMGGFYERLIGSVKRAMRKILGKRRLTLLQLQTTVTEIAEIVNSRPLVALDQEPGEIALTPAHFLAKRGRVGLPPLNGGGVSRDADFANDESLRQRVLQVWKAGQSLLDDYWQCWRSEYLGSLRERGSVGYNNRGSVRVAPTIGTVVQVADPSPRVQWKLGKITELKDSSDGLHRTAKVQLSNGTYLTRSIKHLYPLELPVGTGQGVEGQAVIPPNAPITPPVAPLSRGAQRPSRKAAQDARSQIQAEIAFLDSDDD